MDRELILHKEIDLIQDCIKRMASNSFLIKGWMLSISGIILAIVFNKDVANVYPATWIVAVIILSFWYLDAHFLRIERMFRKLYSWVIENRKTSEEYMYDLNPQRFENNVASLWVVMWSDTLWIFYFIPLMAIVIINAIKYFA